MELEPRVFPIRWPLIYVTGVRVIMKSESEPILCLEKDGPDRLSIVHQGFIGS